MSQVEKGRRGFFAVDVRCFRKACCDINMATAYLVMACGTGGDNGTTSWSVNAIEKYTRISRSRAKTAIEQLIGARLAVQVKHGSYPRYRLISHQEISESELPTVSLAIVLEKIKSGVTLNKQQAKKGIDVTKPCPVADRCGYLRHPERHAGPCPQSRCE